MVYYFHFVHRLQTSACKYNSYLSHSVCFIFVVYFPGYLYVSSVYLTGSVPRWRTKNLIQYILISLSLILCCLFTIFNVIIDHLYKGNFVTFVCIGKKKILLLRPTQCKYLSVYQIHHVVQYLFLVCFSPLGLVW